MKEGGGGGIGKEGGFFKKNKKLNMERKWKRGLSLKEFFEHKKSRSFIHFCGEIKKTLWIWDGWEFIEGQGGVHVPPAAP